MLLDQASRSWRESTSADCPEQWYSARPMDSASARITAKLWEGTLPADEPVKTWGGRGSGLNCDGGDVPILPSESELESDMPDGRTFAVLRGVRRPLAGVEGNATATRADFHE